MAEKPQKNEDVREQSTAGEEKDIDPRLRDSIREKYPDEDELVPPDEEIERMPFIERLQHYVLIACFFALVITGLPLFFRDNIVAKALFGVEGGFVVRSITHRIAGVTMIVLSLFHVGYIIFSKQGNEHFRQIIPKPKDAYDAVHTFMHNLGLMAYLKRNGFFPGLFEKYPWLTFEAPPRIGRYGFKEKFEYFALVWGNVVMITTGLMMWFLEASLAVFPKWFLDVVRVVHGFEALLALLAIVIWHMYNVHLNPEVFPMSKTWLTGKITREELKAHHPLEYEEILEERRAQKQSGNSSDDTGGGGSA